MPSRILCLYLLTQVVSWGNGWTIRWMPARCMPESFLSVVSLCLECNLVWKAVNLH